MLRQHLAHAEEDQQKLSASFEFERERLVQEQRKARRILEDKQSQRSEAHIKEMEIELLRHDIRDYQNMKSGKLSKLREDFMAASQNSGKTTKPRRRDCKRDRGFEPEL